MEIEKEKSNKYKLLKAEIKHLKKELKWRDKALTLQAEKDKIHFEQLNHEAERLRSMQATYLPREVYESQKDEQNKKIGIITDWKNNQQGRQAIILLGWGIVLLLISYFITKI